MKNSIVDRQNKYWLIPAVLVNFYTRINIKLNDRAQSVSQRFIGNMLAEAAAIIGY